MALQLPSVCVLWGGSDKLGNEDPGAGVVPPGIVLAASVLPETKEQLCPKGRIVRFRSCIVHRQLAYIAR